MSFLKNLLRVVVYDKESIGSRSGSRHYKGVISDGLRNGSSESARIMANWRWSKKNGKQL